MCFFQDIAEESPDMNKRKERLASLSLDDEITQQNTLNGKLSSVNGQSNVGYESPDNQTRL